MLGKVRKETSLRVQPKGFFRQLFVIPNSAIIIIASSSICNQTNSPKHSALRWLINWGLFINHKAGWLTGSLAASFLLMSSIVMSFSSVEVWCLRSCHGFISSAHRSYFSQGGGSPNTCVLAVEISAFRNPADPQATHDCPKNQKPTLCVRFIYFPFLVHNKSQTLSLRCWRGNWKQWNGFNNQRRNKNLIN